MVSHASLCHSRCRWCRVLRELGLLELSSFLGIAMLAALIRQSAEIQKVLAFDGIFEKLFSIVTREGGLEGQPVVTDALKCVDTLLRFNTSNQVGFF
jgi:hypothetical protein